MPTAIDATKSGENANSYVTEASADAYFDDLYGAEEWEELDEDVKQRLLLSATKILNRLPAKHDPASATQALKFPVDNDEDGWTEIQEACCLQAWHLYQNNDASQEAITGRIQGVKSESLGKISKSVAGYNQFSKYAPGVLSLLKNFIKFEMKISRA